MKKICIVTGTRAEYGLLKPLIRSIDNDEELILQLVVTGMHLSTEFGFTYEEILKDGFKVADKVEMLLSSDTEIGISKSMGIAMISFADVFEKLKPDMLIILGDRYEIFSVASVAMNFRIPIAHIHGGETTEGAIDEAMRHSITKMSYLHFTSNDEYRKRVIQLGEEPERVFAVGALIQDSIKNLKLLSKRQLQKDIGINFDGNVALLTYHPTTLENNSSKREFENILKAIDEFRELNIVFTKANSDFNGRIINNMIDKYVLENSDRCVAFTSLGQLRYLSAMKYSNIIIGNSSSGIIEAPLFNKVSINIGDRQKGRIQKGRILNCKAEENDIKEAIKKALSPKFQKEFINDFESNSSKLISENIIFEIKRYLNRNKFDLKKKFYDLKTVE